MLQDAGSIPARFSLSKPCRACSRLGWAWMESGRAAASTLKRLIPVASVITTDGLRCVDPPAVEHELVALDKSFDEWFVGLLR